ncbi:hypothetical protein EUX98_g7230 [Antrodiella citrinella]|uniref:PAS domain-containing protein n=1 Tax=Antrodiella citrinella TaxID=2447956 RepID=A0A4S4MM23_9APHY|nr:hypothetical protein EUX98_g7230 [Antrodiella citrinella]
MSSSFASCYLYILRIVLFLTDLSLLASSPVDTSSMQNGTLPPFFDAPPLQYHKPQYDVQKPPRVYHSVVSAPPPAFAFAVPPPPPDSSGDLSTAHIPTALTLSRTVPSALGLPVYSSSGFDLLSVLARVATRPNPKIVLGPVDTSCSFVVTDKRRFDNPIVYVSPAFCKLTGYSEQEISGTNCRFLQAPHGKVQKGEQRKYTSPEAVNHLRAALAANKECQTSMINYRKGGAAFINLVTVIPIPGGVHNTPQEADDYVYHVGFQIDLTEQPNAILNKLRDGTYIVNYSMQNTIPPAVQQPNTGAVVTRDWRSNASAMSGTSKELRTLLTDPAFVKSMPFNVHSTTLASPDKSGDPYDGNKLLNLLLLEATPDFVHVVSLKGAFLYVAPTVKRVLGWEPEELVGRSVTEFCHPADIVPLMRELKESSASSHVSNMTIGQATSMSPPATTELAGNPKVVDLLFRMQAKPVSQNWNYVWLECRGRMHIEPGKGRKAIILSGRVRAMPSLTWDDIPRSVLTGKETDDVWALLSTSGTCLFVGTTVRAVLGWGAGEVIGKPIEDLLPHAEPREQLRCALTSQTSGRREVECGMCRKDGSIVRVRMVVFVGEDEEAHTVVPGSAKHPQTPPKPLICLIRLVPSPYAGYAHTPQLARGATPMSVFEELDPTKSTSWQYELQQLKYANQRLQEEVRELEGRGETTPSDDAGEGDEEGDRRRRMSTKRRWDVAEAGV